MKNKDTRTESEITEALVKSYIPKEFQYTNYGLERNIVDAMEKFNRAFHEIYAWQEENKESLHLK